MTCRKRRLQLLWVLLLGALGAAVALADDSGSADDQPSEARLVQQAQAWFGVMTHTRVSPRSSLWFDTHFVPSGFYVLRTGYTFHVFDNLSITAGYGFLGLPTGGGTRDLKRTEHRPWAQVVHGMPISGKWRYLHRIRYDARFRQNVQDGEIADGFGLTHRVRLMVNFRYMFTTWERGSGVLPYVTFGDEFLVNFGNPAVSWLDQNRVTLMMGVSWKGLSVQAGYMNRLVRVPSGWVMNHTPTLWVFQNTDLRRPVPLSLDEDAD